MNPAIVISAFDRPRSLNRLLRSIESAIFLSNDIPLVISIDGGGNEEVVQIAEEFAWKHGSKRILNHTENLGLKQHIISCGDLSAEYGSVIILEDDLTVSPYFYDFANSASKEYGDTHEVAGISLYAYKVSENGFEPFYPAEDGKDLYLMQVASSWGQLWTRSQWTGFKTWLDEGAICQKKLPEYLDDWSDRSWKKEFIRYLVQTDKWFVFPRVSLTTNHEDPGVHGFGKGRFQVPVLGLEKAWGLPSLEELKVRYDAWFKGTAQTIDLFGEPASKSSSASTFSIIVECGDLGDLETTLNSISSQDYANAMVYVLADQGNSDQANELCRGSLGDSVHWKVVDATKSKDLMRFELIADVNVRIGAGDILSPNALKIVEQVFLEFPSVSLMCGLPESESTVNHRWNKENFHSRWKNEDLVRTTTGIFKRSHVQSNPGSGLPEVYQWISQHDLYLCLQPFVVSNSKFEMVNSSSIPTIEHPAKRPLWKRMATKILMRFNPSSEWYTVVSDLPDVLRYDSVNNTYFMCRL